MRMFDQLVEALQEVLPGFGEHLADDGKAISSWSNHPSKKSDPDVDAISIAKPYIGS